MILIDTGPIVAFFDKNDEHHRLCLGVLKKLQSPLITTIAVLTEAFHLLGYSWYAQDILWEAVLHDKLQVYDLDKSLLKRCYELMNKYNDLPLDFADATLMAIAETKKVPTIFTLDKDFRIYKSKYGKNFRLLP